MDKNLGFIENSSSVHLARTIMLAELELLLSFVNDPTASKEVYQSAIVSQNCLGKRSEKGRVITFEHLVKLYTLDPEVPLFQSFLYFWYRDSSSQPLLALLLACARDPLLIKSSSLILDLNIGSVLKREVMEQFIESEYPERYSTAMLKSAAQNLNSSWTKSGHLSGRAVKVRTTAFPSAGSVAYALYLSLLLGQRGVLAFESVFVKILDTSRETIFSLAESASQKGWMVYKRIGEVVEVQFPQFDSSSQE
jgi:hypothetical protein